MTESLEATLGSAVELTPIEPLWSKSSRKTSAPAALIGFPRSLARELGRFYTLKDEKIWCQDNQRLAPYGLGSAWVSNTHHHYCLQFRNEP